MPEPRCDSSISAADCLVCCDREYGHGGAHHGRVDLEGDLYVYEVSWWPKLAVKREGSDDA